MPRKRANGADSQATRQPARTDDAATMLLTIEAAAGRLSLARATVYKLTRAGTLGSIKIGKARRIPVIDLNAYIARTRREQGLDEYAEAV